MTQNSRTEYNNNTMKKSGITIDDLGMMIQKEFSRIDGNFRKIDEKFDKIDEKFERADTRFDGLESKILRIEKGQKEIIETLDNIILAHRIDVKNLDVRVTKLEEKPA